MATKTDKKNAIRQDIIDSAGIYSKNLAGKAFLYVYGEEFFEVSFPVDHFLHLTGVETNLSAKDFYKNAKKGKLTNNQFYFDTRHPYANAKKKLPCLKRLPELTNEMVCILKAAMKGKFIYSLPFQQKANICFVLAIKYKSYPHPIFIVIQFYFFVENFIKFAFSSWQASPSLINLC